MRSGLVLLFALLLVESATTQASHEQSKSEAPKCGPPLEESAEDAALVAAQRRRMDEHWTLPPGWMHSFVRGKGHAETIVLLHGLHGDGSTFARTGNVLARHNYRVVTIDLRGHGKTPAFGWNYSSRALAIDVKEHLDALNIGCERPITKVHILGHSFGGKVALRFAQLFPERTRSLIVEDMGFEPLEEPKYQEERELGWRIAAHRAVREELTAPLDLSPNSVGPSQLALWRQLVRNDLVPPLFVTQIRGEQFDDALASLRAPTLFLRPADSGRAVLNARQLKHLRRLRPDAQVVEIPRAEHDIHTSKPMAFDQAVVEFLARVGPPTP